ncbi:hypothetical protein Btru_032808 [Bulinus truncatus]|nr:hypothetical protein Btru_032808 [Bulinus truncatus]
MADSKTNGQTWQSDMQNDLRCTVRLIDSIEKEHGQRCQRGACAVWGNHALPRHATIAYLHHRQVNSPYKTTGERERTRIAGRIKQTIGSVFVVLTNTPIESVVADSINKRTNELWQGLEDGNFGVADSWLVRPPRCGPQIRYLVNNIQHVLYSHPEAIAITARMMLVVNGIECNASNEANWTGVKHEILEVR